MGGWGQSRRLCCVPFVPLEGCTVHIFIQKIKKMSKKKPPKEAELWVPLAPAKVGSQEVLGPGASPLTPCWGLGRCCFMCEWRGFLASMLTGCATEAS